jgi:hypothetical protein
MCGSEAVCGVELGALHRPSVDQFCALAAVVVERSQSPTPSKTLTISAMHAMAVGCRAERAVLTEQA